MKIFPPSNLLTERYIEGTVYIFGGIKFRGFSDRTDITLIPTINPDGFDRATEGRCVGKNTFL
jgi:hypothetical protein